MRNPSRPQTELESREIGGVKMECCPVSGGVFLRRGALDRLAHKHGGDIEYSTEEELSDCPDSTLVCPACPGVAMKRASFLRFSAIAVDCCPQCGGVWLDKGALDAVNQEVDRIEKAPDDWRGALMIFLSKLPF